MRTTCLLLAVLALTTGCGKKDGGGAGDGRGAGGTSVGNLPGSYTITRGDNPAGKGHYAGSVNVVQKGSVQELHWIIGGKPAYDGVGIAKGSLLGVGWGVGGSYGVVVYDVKAGKLTGTWAAAGSGALGSEDLEGPAGLSGSYRITQAKTPTGSSYTGNAVITPRGGGLFRVAWTTSVGSYEGAGIQEGDALVVGYGVGSQAAGVVAYKVDGSTWTGRWASPGDTTFGAETLQRQ